MTDKADKTPAIGETVLLVEDEVLLRLAVAEYLRDCGYKVIEAVNADEAVMVLRQPSCKSIF
jgi:CheY-like chemotaxis protein